MDYPSSFSAELRAHCEAGCVPPEVFADASAHGGSECVRYVRIHPMAIASVCRSGEEELRGYQHHLTQAQSGHASLTSLPASWRSRLSVAAPMEALTARFCLRERVKCGLLRQLGLAFDDVRDVAWLPCLCFGLPRRISMASHPLFQDGTLIPMDAASMAGVAALRPRPGDRVLDMCCSPGMKLNCLADAVSPLTEPVARDDGLDGGGGVVVGVDVSVERQYVTRAVLLKHAGLYQRAGRHAPCVALFAADGCHFALLRATAALDQTSNESEGGRLLPGVGLTAHEKRRLQATAKESRKRPRGDGGQSGTETHGAVLPVCCPLPARTRLNTLAADCRQGCFDRVLVDAECTHDGSLAHLAWDTDAQLDGPAAQDKTAGGLTNRYRMQHMNMADSSASAPSSSVTASPRTSPGCGGDSALFKLQLGLLQSGFAQLRVGGTLVYSTCSFSFLQNEYVVWRFLTSVNAALEKDPHGTYRAVPVSPFTYAHEGVDAGAVSTSCFSPSGYDEAALAQLQRELDDQAEDYGVRQNGVKRHCGDAAESASACFITGSRLWPHRHHTSFQYIAKIWKQPYPSPPVE